MVFLLYWFVSGLSVKPTQERNWNEGGFRWVIIGIVIAVLFPKIVLLPKIFGLSIPFLTLSLISHSALLSVASVALVITGLVVALVARRTLAGNWSRYVEIKVDHELITVGIYRYVRHPIYTGVLLMAFGNVLLIGTMNVLLVFLAMLGFFWFKARQEEKVLTKHFPKEYPVYKNDTKALIPFVW